MATQEVGGGLIKQKPYFNYFHLTPEPIDVDHYNKISVMFRVIKASFSGGGFFSAIFGWLFSHRVLRVLETMSSFSRTRTKQEYYCIKA